MARRPADPYASFNYLLVIDNVQAGGFSECTGLQVEVKTFDYKEGGRNHTTLKFPEHASFGNVTLKRGVTNSNELLNWQLDAAAGRFRRQSSQGINFAIVLRNEQGQRVKQWNLIRAFPVKWTGPDLKAGAGEMAVESLEIAHEGILVR
ncbi:MAG TPA: phage tail protein [Pyrinomonadaceae bacterium]|jgi:phage tail-like protein|nr:phage tail protein [Pyrinomonadaceae bacterium]